MIIIAGANRNLYGAAEILHKTGWLFYVVIVIAVIAIIYAIASSVIIEQKSRIET